jgi:hypothetical protein
VCGLFSFSLLYHFSKLISTRRYAEISISALNDPHPERVGVPISGWHGDRIVNNGVSRREGDRDGEGSNDEANI